MLKQFLFFTAGLIALAAPLTASKLARGLASDLGAELSSPLASARKDASRRLAQMGRHSITAVPALKKAYVREKDPESRLLQLVALVHSGSADGAKAAYDALGSTQLARVNEAVIALRFAKHLPKETETRLLDLYQGALDAGALESSPGRFPLLESWDREKRIAAPFRQMNSDIEQPLLDALAVGPPSGRLQAIWIQRLEDMVKVIEQGREAESALVEPIFKSFAAHGKSSTRAAKAIDALLAVSEQGPQRLLGAYLRVHGSSPEAVRRAFDWIKVQPDLLAEGLPHGSVDTWLALALNEADSPAHRAILTLLLPHAADAVLVRHVDQTTAWLERLPIVEDDEAWSDDRNLMRELVKALMRSGPAGVAVARQRFESDPQAANSVYQAMEAQPDPTVHVPWIMQWMDKDEWKDPRVNGTQEALRKLGPGAIPVLEAAIPQAGATAQKRAAHPLMVLKAIRDKKPSPKPAVDRWLNPKKGDWSEPFARLHKALDLDADATWIGLYLGEMVDKGQSFGGRWSDYERFELPEPGPLELMVIIDPENIPMVVARFGERMSDGLHALGWRKKAARPFLYKHARYPLKAIRRPIITTLAQWGDLPEAAVAAASLSRNQAEERHRKTDPRPLEDQDPPEIKVAREMEAFALAPRSKWPYEERAYYEAGYSLGRGDIKAWQLGKERIWRFGSRTMNRAMLGYLTASARVEWPASAIQNGIGRLYRADGALLLQAELISVQGQWVENGAWTLFDATGNTRESRHYKKGLLNGTLKVFWPEGVLLEILEFKDDLPQGEHRFYHQNGKLWIRGAYVPRAVFAKLAQGSHLARRSDRELPLNAFFPAPARRLGEWDFFGADGRHKARLIYSLGGRQPVQASFGDDGRMQVAGDREADLEDRFWALMEAKGLGAPTETEVLSHPFTRRRLDALGSTLPAVSLGAAHQLAAMRPFPQALRSAVLAELLDVDRPAPTIQVLETAFEGPGFAGREMDLVGTVYRRLFELMAVQKKLIKEHGTSVNLGQLQQESLRAAALYTAVGREHALPFLRQRLQNGVAGEPMLAASLLFALNEIDEDVLRYIGVEELKRIWNQ